MAFALPIRNDVLGIGKPGAEELFPLFDNSADYGSQGRLRTIISMNNLMLWEDDPLEAVWGPATSTLSVVAHEFEHAWGVFINPPELLGREQAHWNFYLHTSGSLMGGNDIRDNGDGTFTTLKPKDIYSPLDLYLMGLMSPEEVTPTFLVTEPYELDLPPPYDEEYIFADDITIADPLADVTFRGERKEITIEDIIMLNGPRVPNAELSQKDFQVAFILLTMDNEEPTPDEIDKVEAVRRFWPPYFHRAADNRATMVSTLDGSPENVELPTAEELAMGKFTFTLNANKGLNIISLPLCPDEPFTARGLMEFVNSSCPECTSKSYGSLVGACQPYPAGTATYWAECDRTTDVCPADSLCIEEAAFSIDPGTRFRCVPFCDTEDASPCDQQHGELPAPNVCTSLSALFRPGPVPGTTDDEAPTRLGLCALPP